MPVPAGRLPPFASTCRPPAACCHTWWRPATCHRHVPSAFHSSPAWARELRPVSTCWWAAAYSWHALAACHLSLTCTSCLPTITCVIRQPATCRQCVPAACCESPCRPVACHLTMAHIGSCLLSPACPSGLPPVASTCQWPAAPHRYVPAICHLSLAPAGSLHPVASRHQQPATCCWHAPVACCLLMACASSLSLVASACQRPVMTHCCGLAACCMSMARAHGQCRVPATCCMLKTRASHPPVTGVCRQPVTPLWRLTTYGLLPEPASGLPPIISAQPRPADFGGHALAACYMSQACAGSQP